MDLSALTTMRPPATALPLPSAIPQPYDAASSGAVLA
jgi:hypothetical protein